MERRRVVVIGGGISGLTAAFWLGRSGVDVTVLEKERFAGGTMRTIHDDGWLIETGPNSALETTPLFGEMFDALGIAGERLYAHPASDRRYILRDGVLHPLPMTAAAFFTSSLWTVGGKLRLLKEPFAGRAQKEESIAEFVERRLGREFLDYAINPFVAGVYAGNPEELSVRSAFPRLYALEEKYGGLIKGMIGGSRERKRRAEKAKDRARMFSFARGMQTFPEAIARQLGERIRFGCEVTSIVRTCTRGDAGNKTLNAFGVSYRQNGRPFGMKAGAVIIAVPAYAAARCVQPLHPSLAATLERVYYPPVAEVFLGFPSGQFDRPLDGFGYLIPAKERREILGTIWSSTCFPNRAPFGHVALTSFVGGSRQPHLVDRDDASLLRLVQKELHSLMGGSDDPVYSRIIRWERAIPQYNLGHAAMVEAVDRCEAEIPGLFFCSNFRGGIAVGDCIMSGRRIASRVAARAGTERRESITIS